jgi:hypothetical protein
MSFLGLANCAARWARKIQSSPKHAQQSAAARGQVPDGGFGGTSALALRARHFDELSPNLGDVKGQAAAV